MSTIQIYIPRILGSVNKTDIITVLKTMEIGKIKDIDLHYKINENKNAYYFAFITLELYNTERADVFNQSLNSYGKLRLLYNEKNAQYWEIKLHMDKTTREPNKKYGMVPYYRYSTLTYDFCIKKNMLNFSYNMWESSLFHIPSEIITL